MRRRPGPPGEPRKLAYLYILPAVVVFVAFIGVPLVRSATFSLYEWDGLGSGEWVGLANYAAVFTDPDLRGAFVHALVLIVFYAVVPATLGLLLAATMMRARRMPGLGLFRVLIFLPQVVPMVVVAIAWRQIYAPEGPLNGLLRAVGLDGLARPWLGDHTWALPSVGLVGTWVATGLCFVLFLAGMAKIPRELYEAARLDGARPRQEFFAITLPAVRGELAVALTLTVIAALKTFDLVYVMTSGGPGHRTTVPSYEVYRQAFVVGEVGTATALALVLTAIVFVVTVIINRIGGDADRGSRGRGARRRFARRRFARRPGSSPESPAAPAATGATGAAGAAGERPDTEAGSTGRRIG
ncbi:sugar ABC transporter permease [Actinobacteria bacterium YIM 96077]|uniref:Sugar ABC transporter permease n=1 Tax=Phytoactinopolyspora halophila TaxID=1981511 RepID=A0A329QC27_9ACTN|nr:sugar ABC transporter permease [Phytoactinopolyspora halophila]AYY14114.1 sugar ABC transporter permease [Actinobacteria bacterium YIM 96077]RAW09950.1 sugar ABC transporter permease [Phytoactinopolyspora halophila]